MSDFVGSVAAISVAVPDAAGGEVLGAGFLVAEDLVVTCAHVLGNEAFGATFRVRFPQAVGAPDVQGRLQPETWRAADAEDVAVLKLSPPPGLRPLRLRTAPGAPGGSVETFGFPAQAPVDGHPAAARVGRAFASGDVPLLALTEANAVAQGFSGSPLVDPAGFVVGMVVALPGVNRRQRGIDVAYALPSSVLATVVPGLAVDDRCPYPGLAPFTAQESAWYRGRSGASKALVDRLRQRRGLLVVIGPSGSGKSSLLAAGVVPAFRADVGDHVRASRPGRRPEALQEALDELGDGLLVVDQFEETFAADDPALWAPALTRLADAVDGPGRIVLALRDDFFPALARRAPQLLASLIARQGLFPLTGRLDAEALRDIIETPAATQGWSVEPILVDRLVRDLIEPASGDAAPTDLPLLALSLRRLWDAAHASADHDGRSTAPANCLTVADYDRLGGLRSAFAAWCDEAYWATPEQDRPRVRTLLTSLVRDADPTAGTPATRRRLPLGDVLARVGGADAEQVLDAVVRQRIVVTSLDEPSGEVLVELAHDTLIEQWPSLQQWLTQDHARHRWLDRTLDRASDWQATGRTSGLLDGPRLAEALEQSTVGPTPDIVADFVAASAAAHTARRRRRRLVQVVSVASAVVLGVVAVLAGWQTNQANRARDRAVLAQIVASGEALASTDPSLAARLDLVAYRRNPADDQRRSAILSAQQVPLSSVVLTGQETIDAIAFTRVGSLRLMALGRLSTPGVTLWDVSRPTAPAQISLPGVSDAQALAVAFSPTGNLLAASTDAGGVDLWDLREPRHPVRLASVPARTQDDLVYALAFSGDGDLLAGAGGDGRTGFVEVTDPSRPGTPRRLPGTDTVWNLSAVFVGRRLYVGGNDGAVHRWDLTHLAAPRALDPIPTVHDDVISALAVDPSGRVLATGGSDGRITLRRLKDTSHAITLRIPRTADFAYGLYGRWGGVLSLAFSPDGPTLAAGSWDNVIRQWNLTDPSAPLQGLGHTSGGWAVAYGPDGVLYSGGGDGTLRRWRRVSGTYDIDSDSVTALATTRDRRLLAWGSYDGTVHLRSASSPRASDVSVRPLSGGRVLAVALSPDGRYLAAGTDDGELAEWDLSSPTGRPRPIDPAGQHAGSQVTALAYSPTGHVLAAGTADGLKVWDLSTSSPHEDQVPASGDAGSDELISLAFLPGNRLAGASQDGTVRLWNLATLHASPRAGELLTPHSGGASVLAMSVSDDGTRMAFGDSRNDVEVWDVGAFGGPQWLSTLHGHSNGVDAVAFGTDNHTVVSGAADRTAKVWQLSPDDRHVEHVLTLTGSSGPVTSTAFGAGGVVVTGSHDHTVRFWDIDVARSIDDICTSTTGVLTLTTWRNAIGSKDNYSNPCP